MICIKNIYVEHIYLACGRTDMRKSINGLAIEQPKALKNTSRKLAI